MYGHVYRQECYKCRNQLFGVPMIDNINMKQCIKPHILDMIRNTTYEERKENISKMKNQVWEQSSFWSFSFRKDRNLETEMTEFIDDENGLLIFTSETTFESNNS
jgi:hypothetical protein